MVEPQYIDTERWSVHGTWREKIWFLDWLIRPWVYIMHPYIMGIWVMYTGFLVGGVCFVIGSFATITPSVYQSSPQNTYE